LQEINLKFTKEVERNFTLSNFKNTKKRRSLIYITLSFVIGLFFNYTEITSINKKCIKAGIYKINTTSPIG